MKIEYKPHALKALEDAPERVRNTFYKKLKFLEQDLGHPSLHTKKYDESRDLWQARVNLDWRFYFKIIGDTYVIQDITRHPK